MSEDLYNEVGVLDYAQAARLVRDSRQLGNDTMKARMLDRIKTAALVDIAVSLNALNDKLSLSLDVAEFHGDSDEAAADRIPRADIPLRTLLHEPERDDAPLEAGDWVVPLADDDPCPPARILAVGESEGDSIIDLGTGWLWARFFRKVDAPADAGDDDLGEDFEAPASEKKSKTKTKKGK